MGKVGGLLVVIVAMVALSVATLSTNIAANVVSPANDISNLAPRRISFKMGGYITAIVGILIMPWRLYSDPTGYIFTWLIGYSALLGPIGGILICDYFFIRRNETERA
jgi:NCS1 family nucleobase:cation symporter-1